jgi:hypothetical protein
VNQDTLSLADSVVNEVEDLTGSLVLDIEQDLALLVQPVISQIHHANRFPMIGYLLASTVDDMSNLIRDHKL